MKIMSDEKRKELVKKWFLGVPRKQLIKEYGLRGNTQMSHQVYHYHGMVRGMLELADQLANEEGSRGVQEHFNLDIKKANRLILLSRKYLKGYAGI